MDRRMLLATGLGAGLAPVLPRAASAADGLLFSVARNGSRIGTHQILIRTEGERIETSIEIELTVKIAFITAYRYRHSNAERWTGPRLDGFTSQTNDNGEQFAVKAQRQGESLVVDGSSGHLVLPGDTLPTSWWRPETMQRDRLLDTQKGRMIGAKATRLGSERVPAAGRLVEADHYAVAGELPLDIWYAGERWVKLGFNAAADGSRIEYTLEAAGPAAAGAG